MLLFERIQKWICNLRSTQRNMYTEDVKKSLMLTDYAPPSCDEKNRKKKNNSKLTPRQGRSNIKYNVNIVIYNVS